MRLFPEHRWRSLRAALPHRRRQRWRLRRRGAHGSLHSGRRWVPTQSLFHCRFPHCICTLFFARRAFHTDFEIPPIFLDQMYTQIQCQEKSCFLRVCNPSVSKCHCFPPLAQEEVSFFYTARLDTGVPAPDQQHGHGARAGVPAAGPRLRAGARRRQSSRTIWSSLVLLCPASHPCHAKFIEGSPLANKLVSW